jgi:hypothetical protein
MWDSVKFSSESEFNLRPCAAKQHVWCRGNEGFYHVCTEHTAQFLLHQIIWGPVKRASAGRQVSVSVTVNAEMYINILRDVAYLSSRATNGTHKIFWQDFALSHIVKLEYMTLDWCTTQFYKQFLDESYKIFENAFTDDYRYVISSQEIVCI